MRSQYAYNYLGWSCKYVIIKDSQIDILNCETISLILAHILTLRPLLRNGDAIIIPDGVLTDGCDPNRHVGVYVDGRIAFEGFLLLMAFPSAVGAGWDLGKDAINVLVGVVM